MWGVHYDDADVAEAVSQKLQRAAPGELVIVPIPSWLLFELSSVDPASWPSDLTLVPGRVVVALKPLSKNSSSLKLDPTTFPSLARLDLRHSESVFQPAYCVTIHKLQGVTSSRVVVDLHKCRALVTQSVIVVLSRVRRAAHLRLVPGDLSFLSQLRHDPDLTAFVSSLTPLRPSQPRARPDAHSGSKSDTGPPVDSEPVPPAPMPVLAFDLHAYREFCDRSHGVAKAVANGGTSHV
jgi:hypothetical protein